MLATLCLLGGSSMWGQKPMISSTTPEKLTSDLPCHTYVTATVSYSVEGQEIDPRTLHGGSVRLFPKGSPKEALAADLSYDKTRQLITLVPRETLRPLTTYFFEVNNQLTDDRGFSFNPIFIPFTTGDCDLPFPLNTAEKEPDAPEEEYPSENTGLPFKITQSEVSRADGVIRVSWLAQGEGLIDQYWVERATNDGPYQLVDTLLAMGAEETPQLYIYYDRSPVVGWNRYRLTVRDMLGDLSIRDSMLFFQTGMRVEQLKIEQNGVLPVKLFVRNKSSLALEIQSEIDSSIVKRRFLQLEAGEQVVDIPLTDLPVGYYEVLMRLPDDALRARFEVIPDGK